MLETYCRPFLQRNFVDPLAALLATRKISPLHITFLSGVAGLAFFIALICGHITLSCALLVLSGYFDILDGSVARLRGLSSPLGTVLDIITDRLVEFMAVLGLFCLEPGERGLLCLLMIGSMLLCVTSFLVVGIFSANTSDKSFHYSPGLMERAEAFAFFIAMLLLPGYFRGLALSFVLLVTLTAVLRVMQFARQEDELA